jgi:hypothetical protein
MPQIAQALQDWEYIKKSALKGHDDPFIMTSWKSHDSALLKEIVQEWREKAASPRDSLREDDKYLISKLEQDIKRLGKLTYNVTYLVCLCYIIRRYFGFCVGQSFQCFVRDGSLRSCPGSVHWN